MFEKDVESKAIETCPSNLDMPTYVQGFVNGAKFGYNKGYHDAEEHYMNVIDSQHRLVEESKANEWHKADVPTSPINKVVLGYIKDHNSKKFCLVKWNGEWWYDARTWNDKVKLIAWKEIVQPSEPMRSFDKEEQKNYTEAINKVYKPTGVKLFDKESK